MGGKNTITKNTFQPISFEDQMKINGGKDDKGGNFRPKKRRTRPESNRGVDSPIW